MRESVAMDVVLRAASEPDRAAIASIYRRASLSNERDRPYLLERPAFLEFTNPTLDGTTVAVVDDAVAGFITVHDHDSHFEIIDLFVDPESMRRGIGRALVDHAVDVASPRTLAVDGNVHARAFYEAVGFVVDGTSPTEFGPPALRMHHEPG